MDYLYIVTPGSSNRTEVAVAAINAAKAAGIKVFQPIIASFWMISKSIFFVQFVLLISVFTVPLTDTTFGKQFSEIEKVLKESGLSYTSLQLPFFHENNFGQLVPIKQQGSIYGAVDSDKPFTSVAVKGTKFLKKRRFPRFFLSFCYLETPTSISGCFLSS